MGILSRDGSRHVRQGSSGRKPSTERTAGYSHAYRSVSGTGARSAAGRVIAWDRDHRVRSEVQAQAGPRKEDLMIAALNLAVDAVETQLSADPSSTLDAMALAARLGTTEHHLRRMFSSLAGMPLSEYIRRRRMSLAAVDLVAGDDDLLAVAVKHGYGSTEAFGRAFRAVHGTSPGDVRRDGGPLRTQPRLRFHLTVEGSVPMDTRITELPRVRLVGHATRVPLL